MKRVVFILFSVLLTLSISAQQNCDPENRGENTNAQPGIDNVPFKLLQNFPNPARDFTNIKIQVNCPGSLSLKIYDMVGTLVYFTPEERVQPGVYSLPVETAALPEGVYFYVVKRDTYSQTMKLVISRR